MPGLARRRCPACGGFRLDVVDSYRWDSVAGGGQCTELRCGDCAQLAYRELGTVPMTPDEHTAWRAARVLPRAVVRRR